MGSTGIPRETEMLQSEKQTELIRHELKFVPKRTICSANRRIDGEFILKDRWARNDQRREQRP